VIKITLREKVETKLRITPNIIVHLRLISMPLEELEEEIKNEARENPFLEYEGKEDIENEYIDSKEKYITDEEVYEYELENLFSYESERFSFARNPDLEEFQEKAVELLPDKKSIDELILGQIYSKFSGKELFIAEMIYWSIDEKGYLSKTTEEIKEELENEGIETDEEEIEKVRKKFMEIEPQGIGSKNAREYLHFILSKKFGEDKANKILEKIEKELKDIGSATNFDEGKIKALSEIISQETGKLDIPPYPLYEIYSQEDYFQTPKRPEVEVFEDKGEIYVIPIKNFDVRFSEIYGERWLKNSKRNMSEEQRRKIEMLVQRARNYVEGLKKRENLILKVSKVIFSYQRDFLTTGDFTKIKPMTLEDISKMCNISISTINRTVINKYVKTPYGIFELKKFFTKGISKGDEKISRDAIMDEIRKMIAEEDPETPLSDSAIAKKIKEKFGIELSRRTIVKYRKIMNIPSIEERMKAKKERKQETNK